MYVCFIFQTKKSFIDHEKYILRHSILSYTRVLLLLWLVIDIERKEGRKKERGLIETKDRKKWYSNSSREKRINERKKKESYMITFFF
jgi:hypothetical protein